MTDNPTNRWTDRVIRKFHKELIMKIIFFQQKDCNINNQRPLFGYETYIP